MEKNNSTAYGVGRLLGKTPWWVWLGLLMLVLFNLPRPPSNSTPVPVSVKAPTEQPPTETQICERMIGEQTEKYTKLYADKKFSDAANVISVCAKLLATKRPELMKMLRDAETTSLLLDINSRKKSPVERATAMQTLGRDYPDVGGKYAKQMKSIFAAEDNKHILEEKKLALAEKKRLKSQGVNLGMSKEDVYASVWGRPRSVNRTTGSYGVHEQWVYDGGYLYFENGVLTTIQN